MKKISIKKVIAMTVFTTLIAMFATLSTPKPAKAAAVCCSCALTVEATSTPAWKATLKLIENHFDKEIKAHTEGFLLGKFFAEYLVPAMHDMTDQLTAVGMQQVAIIGTFFDAKHQMETQRLMQNLQARAHKDYHPSMGMCEFGSNVKSLAASERKSEVSALVLTKRSIDRQLGAANTSASFGPSNDNAARLKQFKETYCDYADNDTGLGMMCFNQPVPSAQSDKKRERYNKDIDFVRTVALPWTIEADFTDQTPQNDEIDILALASNLYSHKIFVRPPSESLKDGAANEETLWTQRYNYLDMRALTAKRNVAQNSFNAIVGMKTEGSGGSAEFMTGILEELGINDETEIEKMIGEKPSYHAQMELLTKKIYQNPDFYTNLYDKPANVSRKGVAMQAIGLMQKFDMLKSSLRKEASLSVLLELAVENEESEITKDN